MKYFKLIMQFALPIMMASLVNCGGTFLVMRMMGGLGAEALAAGALIYSVYGLIFSIALSFILPISIFAARHLYENKHGLGLIFRDGIILATLFGILVVGVLGKLAAMLNFFHQPSAIVTLVAHYFHITAYGIIPLMWLLTANQFFVGISKARVMFYMTLFIFPLSLLINYVFIFGKWGLPLFGVMGAAYAGIIVTCLNLVMVVIYFLMKKEEQIFLRQFFCITKTVYLARLFRIGWPIAIQRGAEIAAFVFLVFLMGRLSNPIPALGAQQIVLQYTMLAIIVPFSLSQAIGVLMSQSLGLNQFAKARYLAYTAVGIGIIFMVGVCILFWLLPQTLASFYLNIHNPQNSATLQMTESLLLIAGVTQIFDSLRNIAAGALRAFHDTQIPMWMNVACCWLVGIPLAEIFGFYLHWGARGIACGFTLGIILGALMIWMRLKVLMKCRLIDLDWVVNAAASEA